MFPKAKRGASSWHVQMRLLSKSFAVATIPKTLAEQSYSACAFPMGLSALSAAAWNTVEKFKQYLENDLLPYLNPDSVLVMDNMKSHHAKAIKQLLEEAKVRYVFLPPYSPDLNPIENLWSKVKALLRKFKARTLETLPDAIQHAFRAVTPSDCSGWFRACGYSR